MSAIRTGTGLISGLDIAGLVDSLSSLSRAPVARMEQRVQGYQTKQTGIQALDTVLLSFSTSIQQLSKAETFNAHRVNNSDTSQIAVTTGENAALTTYQFEAIQQATTFETLSRGFASSDQQAVGAGTITIATGGSLHQPTTLDAFNQGNGIQNGRIKITDRSGSSAEIDLSNAYMVDDVLTAINDNSDIQVTASTAEGHLVLTDTSGGGSNLIVAEVGTGRTAADLGIAGSVAADTLTGQDVYGITDDFPLSALNDGNGLQRLKNAPDLRITLTDDSTLEVNLDDARSIGDVVNLINNHDDNGGSVTAALSNGRLTLTDNSGGGGSAALGVADINGSSVVRQLGLDATAAGTTLTGNRVAGGVNSVLLRNLRGGAGIDQTGQISLTDRDGNTATLDLTGAESLDEVIAAINSAEDNGTPLGLSARINDRGTGIIVEDTTGGSASNLIIADVGGSTLATQLGLAVDAAETSVDSGSLNLRFINEATTISDYAPDGGSVAPGTFLITDSAGNQASIDITSAVKTVGDVMQRINIASGISVRAELNETGDGFVIIDEAGGPDPLKITEGSSTTAADLRIIGEGTVGSSGASELSSRFSSVIEISATDTLEDVRDKINSAAGYVQAEIFNDGSSFSPYRLKLSSTESGSDGNLLIDTGGVNLGLSTTTAGQDALLRRGSSAATGFLLSSSTNTFEEIAEDVDVEIRSTGKPPATVTISQNTTSITSAIQSFVSGYNSFVQTTDQLTLFDLENNKRGVLQGDGVVLRLESRMQSLLTRRIGSAGSPVRSLVDLGIQFTDEGKLELDSDQLKQVLAENPAAVEEFFTTEETGFGAVAESTVDSMIDPFSGTLTLEQNALKANVEGLTKRIDELDSLLARQKERLLLQFVKMEETLSSLTTQQQALSGIAPLSVNPAPKAVG